MNKATFVDDFLKYYVSVTVMLKLKPEANLLKSCVKFINFYLNFELQL